MKKLLLFLSLASAGFAFIFFKCVYKTTKQNTTDTIIVGTNATFPPFSYIDNGEITGFDIELIKLVGTKLGKKIVLKDMNFDSIIIESQSGRIQVIAAGISSTPERAKKVFFTNPHVGSDPFVAITLKKHEAPKSITDLEGKEVIVNEGFTAESFMKKQKNVKLMRLTTAAEAFLALTTNRGYAYVSARSAVQPFFDKHGIQQFNILMLDGADSYAFAVSKHCPELFEQIQKTLEALEKSGELKALKTQWHLNF